MNNSARSESQALIVDDEADICYLLKGILRHKNIEADHVSTLHDAKKFLQACEPPVIFLDNHLSDGLGINYVRQFKEQHPRTKIIMITAHDNSEDRERAYAEGADFFIGKPFTVNIILKTIENMCG